MLCGKKLEIKKLVMKEIIVQKATNLQWYE